MNKPQAVIPLKTSNYGQLLRQWRKRRKYSQLELALSAQVSQRHLSFLESGRAQPSREMVLLLCDVLEVPLRDRNGFFHAAGFSPLYPKRAFDSAEMAGVRAALDMLLRHHQPYPAFVLDRHWNLLAQNAPAAAFLNLLGESEALWQQIDPSGQRNVMLLTFHPAGLQTHIDNWEEVSTLLLARLRRERLADPGDDVLAGLCAQIETLPGARRLADKIIDTSMLMPVLPLRLNFPQAQYQLFSMISSFGTALDLTADELRVETFFPMDAITQAFLQSLMEKECTEGGAEGVG